MQELFTNSLLIKVQTETLAKILLDMSSLMQWNPGIAEVSELSEDSFAIHRTVAALNKNEIITLSQTDNQIIYQSTGGKLAYQLIFTLSGVKNYTTVVEKMFVADKNNLNLPLTLLGPIAKHAFNQNLQSLKEIAEIWEFK